MGNTRDFKSLGVYAKDAQATFPGQERVDGNAYRNIEFSNFQQAAGKGYNNTPTSENVNQQIHNQSSFTSSIDTRGVLGWKNDITYNIGALVMGSDGKLYQSVRDDINNFDPIKDDQESPNFWQELKNSTDLSLDLSSQTPGDEGAEQVGTFDEFKSPGGRTLQKSLDENAEALYKMNNMNIKAYTRFRFDRPYITPVFIDNFNILSITPTINNQQTEGKDILGYVTINFINAVSTDSIVSAYISPFSQLILENATEKTIVKHFTSNSYADFTATNIKLGSLSLTQYVDLKQPGDSPWPAFEDLECRVLWDIMLMIYTIEP